MISGAHNPHDPAIVISYHHSDSQVKLIKSHPKPVMSVVPHAPLKLTVISPSPVNCNDIVHHSVHVSSVLVTLPLRPGAPASNSVTFLEGPTHEFRLVNCICV